jgi:hypothetical protein
MRDDRYALNLSVSIGSLDADGLTQAALVLVAIASTLAEGGAPPVGQTVQADMGGTRVLATLCDLADPAVVEDTRRKIAAILGAEVRVEQGSPTHFPVIDPKDIN